ncbi:Glucan 1,3-beta-glucosidase 3 [Paraconiothyrium brasiliense]|uniref:Glucan 1,3-beta-glucosidase 3 n=1 Tax=Paraconiothyrium brasiliense TaxID=300254 RepID=A0ABR3R7T6_9PLEO
MKNFIGKAHKLFNADLAAGPQPPSEKRNSKLVSASKTSSLIVPSSTVGFSGINSRSNLLPTIQDPSALDILRYRYHHATNLGSVYVLERWLSPSRFPQDTSGSSELEAVKAWVAKIGADQTKQMFETCWANAILDDDIDWLKNEAKGTTVRLPIGYWDLPGEEFTRATPFEPVSHIYFNAWTNIRDLILRLRAHNIGVLIDFHAVPGGANTNDHSGTNSNVAEFFTSPYNRKLGIRCAEFVARESAAGLQLAGLSLVNEPDTDSETIYDWYDETIHAVSSIDSSLPIVISDAWDLKRAIGYSLSKNAVNPTKPTNPIVIDTHVYWCFNDADKKKSPQDIIQEVPTKLSELNGKEGCVTDRGAVQVIIGEYSNVLSADTWVKTGETPKADLIQIFGAEQSLRYQQRAGGAFFWTWKMDWMPGGEWGFKAQSNPQNRFIFPPPHAFIPERNIPGLLECARNRKEERMWKAVDQHRAYYDHLAAKMPADHSRYEHGWKIGYADAYVFFEGKADEAVGPGNRLGNVELWVLKRIRESGFAGDFVWEYEQGLRRGIHDFNAVVGI